MVERALELAESGWHTAARDFVPESHRNLPMLRLYLPFIDRYGNIVRWSRYVDVEQHSASISWFEGTGRAAEEDPAVRDLVSCMGHLDDATAAALREAIDDLALRCLRWVGYGEVPHTDAAIRVFGEEYFEAELTPDDVSSGCRVPEFAWDAERRLAWGARLYPDSLIVAAELSIFRQLRNDPRLDTVSVRSDSDVLPGSAGD